MTPRSFVVPLIALLAAPAAARAQGPAPPASLLHGVPGQTAPTAEPLPLSLADAVRRGLDHNLAVIVQEQQVATASSERLRALSDLLPHADVSVTQSTQILNTAAFGFNGFGGLPNLIGPFGVFDARLRVSAPLVDLNALHALQSERAADQAAAADLGDVRETVVLAVGNVYLEARADESRVAAAQAQVTTADALVRLAEDQNAAGLVARIDVVGQQVQQQLARAALIRAQNALAKHELQLARAIGLPAGQAITLTDTAAFSPAPDIELDAAVTEATAHRNDLKAARARAESARADRAAAVAKMLPSLYVNADVGTLGNTAAGSLRTYTVAASVRVPVFEGGANRAGIARADALVKQREAELADVEAGVRYEISEALLDLKGAAAAVDVARQQQTLAQDELRQAQDRFQAGVATSVELVQAQDAVARGSEQYIESVYEHNLAKARLARALGEVESRFLDLVGGSR
jgi:outer membrane protein TolC